MSRDVVFVVPPGSTGVVRDYAGGLGFEPRSTYVLPPLDLLQLAAMVEEEWSVALLDYSWSDARHDALGEVIGRQPAAVIVQASLPTLLEDVEWARRVRAAGSRVLVRLSMLPPALALAASAGRDDEWLLGECELSLPAILRGVRAPGLASGIPRPADIPPVVEDLDRLPMPARALAAGQPYAYPKLGPCTTVLASRGCPFTCAYYCPYPLAQGKTWRSRSVGSILAELRAIVITHGQSNVLFRDAVFTLDQQRTRELCSALAALPTPLRWWCETRADLLEPKTVVAMAHAGCVGVNLGVESGDEALRLRELKARVTDRVVEQTCRNLADAGIAVALLMMVGWPGEERRSLVSAAELIVRCGPRDAGLVFPTAYPGTAFHSDVARRGALASGPLPTAGERPSVRSDTLSFADMIEGRRLIEQVVQAVREASSPEPGLMRLRAWAAEGDA